MYYLGPRRNSALTLEHAVVSFVIALVAGAFGSVLGIGGGLFIIPSLTLFLGVKLKTAIAASIVAVIATSLGGGNVYVRRRLADIRLGLLLALATVPGAVIGALLATRAPAQLLAGVFAVVLGFSAYRMLQGARRGPPSILPSLELGQDLPPSRFRGSYVEPSTGEVVRYHVIRAPLGVVTSTAAGLVSGLLGVGGGIIQVPVMNLLMRVPIKVATTTSTYIIGITAMAGAFVYYNHRPSYIDPSLAVPVTIGVFIGASVGSGLLGRLSQVTLRNAFTAVMAVYTVQMALRVFGIGSG
ncbi:MAG TPA: sulfite exporter TauE/SafE family protein [Chloroflexota bacterium]|nr:sulfite exporter TauE/SafE family protein [Chloroflexota bacterium]